MRNKMMKRVLAGMLVFAVAAVGFLHMPKKVEAATDVVRYQKVSNNDFITCIEAKKAPECTLDDDGNVGYLFAGWYEDEALTKPIAEKGQITAEVYAKFVPSYLTGVACQIDLGEGESRNLRVVSLVHSSDYSAVGFNVYGRYDQDGDGSNETEWLMYAHDSENKAETTTLYRGLQAYDEQGEKSQVKYPQDVFGADAEGFYFTTVSITGIGVKTDPSGKEVDFKDATMAIQPYWITLDGTYVEGMSEFNRVHDYRDKIVNVSINLKNATDIAAGLIHVTCPEGFTLVEGECGRVFEEMECAQRGTVIKCAGNVSTPQDTSNPNDVYMNLRLRVEEGKTVTLGSNGFTVSIPDKGFSDIEETVRTDVDAWNIRY